MTDYHTTAGKIFGKNQKINDYWANYFNVHNINNKNNFHPFVSETEWKFSKWLIEEDIGKSAADRLMSINKVSKYSDISISS